MPILFNDLLHKAGIDPKTVLLLRHRDRHVQPAIYAAALAGDARFDDYQRSQCQPQILRMFERASHIAGFVVGPTKHDCVFAGLWELGGLSGEVYHDPFPGMAPSPRELVMFTTARCRELAELRSRLVIDWGTGFKAWCQWAARRDKPVVELFTEPIKPPFPDFASSRFRPDEIETLPIG
jgi:hypothetical protein